jgi:TolB-like protein/DNA-binding winged helix-turn-helix (wHTH) protein/Tfp pilus assembly protein PilF
LEYPVCKYRFGPFEVSTRTHELHKQGRKLKLRPQPYQVLLLLLENGGDVVTREQVRARVWASDTFVDFEHGLNTAIKELRGVLSDSAKEPRYVETLPRVGYRLIVRVEKESGLVPADIVADPTAAGAGVTPASPLPSPVVASRARRAWALAAVTALVVAGVLFTVRWMRTRTPAHDDSAAAAKTAGRPMMLAVLPFENLTGDPGEEYFSDGLTEEMIAQLGRLDPAQMGVIGRASVMRFKHSPDALGQAKRELGVQYVLEGSVRRDHDRVRVTAALIQTKDQTRLWGKEYDRDLSNLLQLQAEIAGEIATEVNLRLAAPVRNNPDGEKSLSAERLAAYDLYLRGRFFFNKRTFEGLERAVQCFQQAVEKDPSYPRAYAGLADTYALMSSYRFAPPKQAMPKAQAAAKKAVELDPSLAEAHTSLAVIAQNYDWDWKTAESEYRRAIELDPNYATAHHWYAEVLALVGRFPESEQEIERAHQLDPLSLIINADYGAILYFSRQYEPAITQLRAVLEMEPYFPRAWIIAFPYVEERKYAEALAALGMCQAGSKKPPPPWDLCAYVYAKSGDEQNARRALKSLLASANPQAAMAYYLAVAELGMGDNQKALDYLEIAYEERNISTAVGVDPVFDPLRNEPRFHKILEGMHLK